MKAKTSTTLKTVAAFAATSCLLLASSPMAGAEESDPAKILKAMTDYVVGQTTISATIDTDIEVITPELQKIQFASSSTLLLNRPDKLRVSRTGGYAHVDLVFDGKTVTMHGKHLNVFARIDAPGSTDQLIDRLRSDFSVEAPGADLLLTKAYDELMADVLEGAYIGHGVVGGIECDHLAFRNQETDWQIWIERGPKPIPRKYVITSKAVAGAPQYTLVVRDWQSGVPIAADAFAFTPSADAKKVAVGDLPHMDEVPAAELKGGRQ